MVHFALQALLIVATLYLIKYLWFLLMFVVNH